MCAELSRAKRSWLKSMENKVLNSYVAQQNIMILL